MKRLFAMTLSLAVALTALNVLSVGAVQGITTTENDALPQDSAQLSSAEELQILSDSPVTQSEVTSRSSQEIIDFIKSREGYSATPYWDVSQWTVGYGTYCKNKDGTRCTDYNGGTPPDSMDEAYLNVSREQAEIYLRQEIANNYERSVAQYESRHGLSFTQSEFDALVSFTFNLGAGWTSGGYMITDWLEGTTSDPSDLGMVRAMGAWCRVSGRVNPGTSVRRLREAQIFLYSDYAGESSEHPNYRYVKYDGNGSLLSGRYTDAVDYFTVGSTYDTLLEPVWRDPDRSAAVFSADNNVPYAQADLPFTDVNPGDWFYQDVCEVYQRGIMNGVSDTRFSPQGNLSRAHVVTVLYRLDGSPEVSGSSGFDDVPEGWYADAVTWAFQNGIVEGVSATRFNPNGNITREQIATILYRYYVEYLGNSPSGYADLNGYIDGDETSAWAEEAVRWAVSVGLIEGISGTANGTILSPRGTSTRAQAAALLVRLIGLESGPETGPVFLGWYNEDGERITNDTEVVDSQILVARWSR